jgi:hypothetical protein
VELRQTTDPVSSLIDDARAVALTENLPQDVASRVPGFCRSAVEAACMESVRRRRRAFHPYELPPTREELAAWDEVVMEVVEATEREWR